VTGLVEAPMYSIDSYGRMIADSERTNAYAKALRQAIRPGSIVLDIGSGLGIFAVLACRFGAARVYALEPDDVIHTARAVAARNGCAARIEFIQNRSGVVTLPERVDVIVSDLHGVLPCFQQDLSSVIDARLRFLAPGGVLIPRQESLWASVANAPELYRRHTSPWGDDTYGVDFGPASSIVSNTWRKSQFLPQQLITEPQCWAVLDYTILETVDVHGELSWKVAHAGTAHGLCVWFDSVLGDGIAFSNAPGAPELIFGSAFLPWLAPISLDLGDVVAVALHADLIAEDYVWRWDTRVLGQGDPERIKADFKQSTFFGVPLSPAQLRKQASGHLPVLDDEGQIDRQILVLMDGAASVGNIADKIRDLYPARFASWQDALTRVGELSKKYSR
jgi:protein arginine N-methyltransferase 1